jgi:hypothetical protein
MPGIKIYQFFQIINNQTTGWIPVMKFVWAAAWTCADVRKSGPVPWAAQLQGALQAGGVAFDLQLRLPLHPQEVRHATREHGA